MNEKPLERLNYFNGQRLQAADLKTEQDYHIRVRRWLNRSLYSAGIAEGLSVYAIKDQPRVRVTPGLAIDHLGREIILLEEQIVDVVGTHHDRDGRCDGPYLTIRYREDIVGKQDLSCAVGGNASDRVAWGAPARILADPVLELNAELPNEGSGKIPLACLTLTDKCKSVQTVDTGVRRYIGESSANKVKQYALEGVRDLDADNPATIVFHVRGRQPSSVTLYLRSEPFPTMFYTETGRHVHGLDVSLAAPDGEHRHELGNHQIPLSGGHPHSLTGPFVQIPPVGYAGEFAAEEIYRGGQILQGRPNAVTSQARWDLAVVEITRYAYPDDGQGNPYSHFVPNEGGPASIGIATSGAHSHVYGSQEYTAANDASSRHTHQFASKSLGPGGIDDAPNGKYWARTTHPLTYIEDLQIDIDKQPVRDAVLAQINNNNSARHWNRIGEGTGGAGDPLAEDGTDAIRVDFLVPLSDGPHTIKLSVNANKADGSRNGGRIHFNLYVE
jgi:hypothetical protein